MMLNRKAQSEKERADQLLKNHENRQYKYFIHKRLGGALVWQLFDKRCWWSNYNQDDIDNVNFVWKSNDRFKYRDFLESKFVPYGSSGKSRRPRH